MYQQYIFYTQISEHCTHTIYNAYLIHTRAKAETFRGRKGLKLYSYNYLVCEVLKM